MKTVALISGGKDSLFAILHCIQNGHEVVALANLYPAEETRDDGDQNQREPTGLEDIDSYMYQTIGHRVIPLYEQALGIPLFREEIRGTAINKDKSYAVPNGDSIEEHDETESLTLLLQRVKAHHPDLQAVSSGAILSDYQRTRVESVSLRLNLVPLAFLWQYPEIPPFSPSSLLEDMNAVGQDSRIVKTASGRLDERHLWMNVAEPRSIVTLQKAAGGDEDSRGACLGEGGEFETLAVNGPSPVWRKQIEVTHKTNVATGGGSWITLISEARCIDKTAAEQSPPSARVPDLIEPTFQRLLNDLDADTDQNSALPPNLDKIISTLNLANLSSALATSKPATASGIIELSFRPSPLDGSSLQDQISAVLNLLRNDLKSIGLSPDDILLCTVLLRNMDDFPILNQKYGALFRRPNPPARITIAVGSALPETHMLNLSVVVRSSPAEQNDRQGLHVQSQSYWAPANIGPYSQAVTCPLDRDETSRLVFVAGQIPLIPASMRLVTGGFATQTILALQHLWRIGRRMQVYWWSYAMAYITADSVDEAQQRSIIAGAAWRLAHESQETEDEAEDIDLDEQQLFRGWASSKPARQGPIPLPDRTKLHFETDDKAPPCFIAQVEALPRAASIEWTSQGLEADHIYIFEGGCKSGARSFITQAVPKASLEDAMAAFLATPADDLRNAMVRVWIQGVKEIEPLVEELGTRGVNIIPCHSLWDAQGTELGAVVHWNWISR